MNEIEVFQLIMKGLISDLSTDEVQAYRNFYEELKVRCTGTGISDDTEPRKLAVIMYAFDLVKEQMKAQGGV